MPNPAATSRLRRPTESPSLTSRRAHATASSSEPRSSDASCSPLMPYARYVVLRPNEACIGTNVSLSLFIGSGVATHP